MLTAGIYSIPIRPSLRKTITKTVWSAIGPNKQLSWSQKWKSFDSTIVVTHKPLEYKAFNPCGLATDSIGHIFVADCDNFVIHVIDITGQLILFMDRCHLQYPWGLCIDRTDNLFVAECYSNDVKRIKYQK